MLGIIADVLQPYKELVGTIAVIVTTAQMGSGGFICWDIYKQGNTKGIGLMPFAGGIIMSVLNLKYGFILRDDAMIRVNFFGLALNTLYLLIFFNYAQDKFKVWLKIGATGAFSAAILAYADYEDPKLVETRLGTVITAFMFFLIASPLFGLKQIIKNKSTEGLPFPMIASGTLVTFMWLLYGIILRNNFLVVQNVVAFVLCISQLSLFVIYPSKGKGKEKIKAKAKKVD